MEYLLLHSEYYKNEENFNKLYKERYSSDFSIHLPLKISGFSAFFMFLPDFVKMVEDTCFLYSKILGIESSLPKSAIQKIYIENLVEEVILTNDIEGVNSSKKEIDEALESIKGKVGKKKFQGLVNKYLKLITNEHPPLKCAQDIRVIYDELVSDEIEKTDLPDGKVFRKGQVEVTSVTQRVKHTGIYPEEALIEFMNEALSVFSLNTGKLIQISLFHYLFGYAHPFYDGNGRTSRFISSSLLQEILGTSIAMNLSYAIKNSKSNYEKVFDICNDEKNCGDLTPFIIYFLNVVKQAAERAYSSLESANDKFVYYVNRLDGTKYFEEESIEYKILFLLIQVSLFGNSFISMSEIESNIDASSYLIKKAVSNIEKYFIIAKKTINRKSCYSLDLKSLESAK